MLIKGLALKYWKVFDKPFKCTQRLFYINFLTISHHVAWGCKKNHCIPLFARYWRYLCLMMVNTDNVVYLPIYYWSFLCEMNVSKMITRSSTNIRACTYRSAHVVYKIVLFSKRRNELDEYIYENNRYQYISYQFDITRMCFKHNVRAALSTIFIWEILRCKDAKKLDLDLFLCNFKNKHLFLKQTFHL